MIIEFTGLSEEEKQLVVGLERKYPEQMAVRELVAGFDGAAAMQLITDIVPEIIAGIFTLASALIALKSKKKDAQGENVFIFVIYGDGKREPVNSLEDLEEKLKDERA